MALKRNRLLLQKNFKVVNDVVITAVPCKILIPYNYLKYRMANIGEKIHILAVAAVVIGDEYGILNGCCSLEITPSATRQIMVGGNEFLEFSFEAGAIVIPTIISVKDSDLLFEMHQYFYSNGRVPWFLNYRDLGHLFSLHREYGGLNIARNNIPFEIVVAMICRDPSNKYLNFRHTEMKLTPVVVPFNSVFFNASSTTAKLLGSNLVDGFTSAIANPSTKPEAIENLLRR